MMRVKSLIKYKLIAVLYILHLQKIKMLFQICLTNFRTISFQLFQPQIFATRVLDIYNKINQSVPTYLNNLKSSLRTINGDVINEVKELYFALFKADLT